MKKTLVLILVVVCWGCIQRTPTAPETVNLIIGKPEVTLLCNGQKDSCPVSYRGVANVTWSATNATICPKTPASGNWDTHGYIPVGNLTSNRIYYLVCKNDLGDVASADVTILVGSPTK